jgi:hypothetical protein
MTLIVCPISACTAEIEVSQLIRDDFFTSVFRAAALDDDIEFVDVDASSGAWRPVREKASDASIRAGRRSSRGQLASVSLPSAAVAAAGQQQQRAGDPTAAQRHQSGRSHVSVKLEAPAGAPTFFDLTGED